MNAHLPPNWAQRLLALLGAPLAEENQRLLLAWALAEGGTARWNPLNTTYPLESATLYNSAGVRNYRKPIVGICATALTLINGYYTGILGSLQGGLLSAEQIVEQHAHEFDTWGTGSALILRVLAAHPSGV